MSQLISLFWSITLFRKGPQDVPYSRLLLYWMLTVDAGVNSGLLIINAAEMIWAQVLADTCITAAFTWPLLYFAGLKARFMQTWTSLLGTDVIISLFAAAPLISLEQHANNAAQWALLLLLLWHWLVYGHIFRHALNRSWSMGLALALFYILLSSQIMGALFPPATAATPQ
jgi:hypothetical protein